MSNQICSNCGETGKTKTVVQGSFMIEVVLWCFGILPGVVYSLWRGTTRTKGCGSCGSSLMVSVDSPMGKKLLQDLNGV